jgi:hypothetical protein
MTKSEAERRVEKFNLRNPPGTPVVVTKDDGTRLETKTRSIAWIVGGKFPVVMVEGISGGYSLDRVRLLAANEATQTNFR